MRCTDWVGASSLISTTSTRCWERSASASPTRPRSATVSGTIRRSATSRPTRSWRTRRRSSTGRSKRRPGGSRRCRARVSGRPGARWRHGVLHRPVTGRRSRRDVLLQHLGPADVDSFQSRTDHVPRVGPRPSSPAGAAQGARPAPGARRARGREFRRGLGAVRRTSGRRDGAVHGSPAAPRDAHAGLAAAPHDSWSTPGCTRWAGPGPSDRLPVG